MRVLLLLLFVLALIFLGLAAHAQSLTIVPVKPNPDLVVPTPKPKYLILPPVEFDHPYAGKLTVETVATREELSEICGKAFTQWTLGCAFRHGNNGCRIVLADESIIKARGWTVALIMRHEIGHCNGWPGDHPGERPYDAK
jgi:hypothetical protein